MAASDFMCLLRNEVKKIKSEFFGLASKRKHNFSN